MITINPESTSVKELHGHLLSAVAPRPIAFASTMDRNGQPNLSPFSFFNVFSAHPPIAIFSPARRVRDNTTKHTLENAQQTKEVVINIVNYSLVQQTSLASTEYAKGVNEFVKAGLTPVESQLVKPFRVKESPVHLECVVNDIVPLGTEGGAGNLVICEIKLIHISESILNSEGKIDPYKIDLVGRMGGNWYSRASGEAIFEVEKPLSRLGIGVDAIPGRVRNSFILTGNDLGRLGNVGRLPTEEEVDDYKNNNYSAKEIINSASGDDELRELLHQRAKELLAEEKVSEAWKTLLIDKLNRT